MITSIVFLVLWIYYAFQEVQTTQDMSILLIGVGIGFSMAFIETYLMDRYLK